MGIAVDKRHRDVYKKQGWIECENLLSPAQAESLYTEALEVLDKRKKEAKTKEASWISEQNFLHGHDIWRESTKVRKTFFNKAIVSVVTSIIENSSLRLGYDQLYQVAADGRFGTGSFSTILASTPTLEELSAIQGVTCGLMLCLKSPAPNETISSSTLFPLVSGNGVLFSSTHPIPFSELATRLEGSYLLLVFTQTNAVYIYRPTDPHIGEFKKLGYSFGDKLTDLLNPLISIQ